MSESRTFVFPEGGNSGGGTNGVLAMLPALMQQRGVDPNILALMGGKNGGNGNGWGDGLFAILLLFILMGAFNGNGFGGFGGGRGMAGNGQGGVVPFVQNDANTAVIMQAVQRNGFDIQSLATALNTSSDAVMAAINGLGGQICNLGNQMGQNTNQVLTAIMQGNNSIITQLCNCCCETNNNITKMGYENQLGLCKQTDTLVTTANQNTLSLRDAGQANTQAIIAKLDAMQNQNLLDKIDALRESKSALQAQLSQEHQTAQFSAMLSQYTAPLATAINALQSDVNGIKCKLPNTVPVVYPQLSVYNPEIAKAAAYGAYAGDVAAQAVNAGCGC